MEHITSAQFLALYPQFTDAPADLIDFLIGLCSTAGFNVCLWGPWLQWGEANWIAHYLTLRYMNAGGWNTDPSDPSAGAAWLAGNVQSDVESFRAGSVDYTKNAAMQEKFIDSPYMRTLYGQEYLATRSRLAVGLPMVT